MVRQALMQNQTPEIQAKLLAMQKHMVQQKQDDTGIKTIMPSAIFGSQISRPEITRTVESQEAKNTKQKPAAFFTPEQKETHAR